MRKNISSLIIQDIYNNGFGTAQVIASRIKYIYPEVMSYQVVAQLAVLMKEKRVIDVRDGPLSVVYHLSCQICSVQPLIVGHTQCAKCLNKMDPSKYDDLFHVETQYQIFLHKINKRDHKIEEPQRSQMREIYFAAFYQSMNLFRHLTKCPNQNYAISQLNKMADEIDKFWQRPDKSYSDGQN